jgi:hypothetical protein
VSVAAQGSHHDDVADAVLLLADAEISGSGRLPTCGGDAGRVEARYGSPSHDEEGIHGGGVHYVEVLADGSEQLCETPEWDPGFSTYAAEMVAIGVSTPAIERWKARGGAEAQPMNVQVDHGERPASREGFGWGGGFSSSKRS